jgi:glycosyltransferase involved in cell wall biosynthesis
VNDVRLVEHLGEPVLHVVTSTQRRGAELVAWTLVSRLSGDHRLVALAPARTGKVLPIRALGPSSLHPVTLLRLRRLAARSPVVVAHGSRALPAAVAALSGMDGRLVYVNIGDPAYWGRGRLRRLRLRRLYRRVDVVASLTEGAAVMLQRDFHVPSAKLRVMGSGRALSDFPAADGQDKGAARRELGLSSATPVVAYVGALSPEKRVDVLIDAVCRVPGATLVVAGDGPLRADLETAARGELGTRSVFLGVRDDPARVMAAADVVALTSDTEGLPGVCIEAGLVGRPVVATDVGFVRDIVRDGVTGYVVPRDDPDTTARALQDAVVRTDLLGAAARSHCVARYDLDIIVRRWDQLLAEMRPTEPREQERPDTRFRQSARRHQRRG